MNDRRNAHLTSAAQSLRKNMTAEERRLWYDFLKQLPFTVNRQKIIGKYIVDFYCAAGGFVIEVDGSQHYEADGLRADAERDAYLQGMGIRVLRYSNYDINSRFREVCQDIWRFLPCDEDRRP